MPHWILSCWALVISLTLLAGAQAMEETVTLYGEDPAHLWNRLYSGLLVRATPDGKVEDDLLDPPLWASTKHLLSGESHRKAITLLREFSAENPADSGMSPLQRAVMQRDLLAVFHWVANLPRESWTPGQRALTEALAHAIRKVALTADEIHLLPDNYTAAIGQPGTPTAPDPAHPERPFLPADLLSDEGEWIALEPEGDDWLPATVHFKSFHGRSAFEVRMRHPGGRAQGEAYLRQLADMILPFVFEKPDPTLRDSLMPHRDFERGPWINPETPQFPIGTAWALVRRAVLADAEGRPVLSPLVESVQIRIYHSMEADVNRAQYAFEWETRHRLLLGEGGFHLTAGYDQRFSHFMKREIDLFETKVTQFKPGNSPDRLNCYACHDGVGIHSVLSRARLFETPLPRPPEFRTVTAARIAQMTEIRAREIFGWQLLQWLWPEQASTAGD